MQNKNKIKFKGKSLCVCPVEKIIFALTGSLCCERDISVFDLFEYFSQTFIACWRVRVGWYRV